MTGPSSDLAVAANGGAASTSEILSLWRRLVGLPGGRHLFSLLLAARVPYAATVRPRVELLSPGHARVVMPDRRRARNHLGSIHAAALANLGELAGNLALLTTLPPGGRMIVASLAVEFLKKARGSIVAECRLTEPARDGADVELQIALTDGSGAVVARAKSRCRVALPNARTTP